MGADAGASRRERARPLHAVARGHEGPPLRRLPGAASLVGRTARGLLGDDVGVPRHSRLRTVHARARRAEDARGEVVRGRAAQLRGARLPARRTGPAGDHRALGSPRCVRSVLGRARAAGRGDRRQPARDGRAAGRPGRVVHAEHPGNGRRVLRGHEPRRGLVELLARHGHRCGRGPVPADRAQGAVRGRRVPLWREVVRSARGPGRDRRRAAVARARGVPAVSGSGRAARGCAAGASLVERRRARGEARVRAGAVRPSAVDRLLVRHDRRAESDRARPRRHRDRASEDAAAAQGDAAWRPVLLDVEHRLDRVDAARERTPRRLHDRDVRRQSRRTPTRARSGGWSARRAPSISAAARR